MRTKEATDALSLGSDMILFTLLCSFLLLAAVQAGNIRTAKEFNESAMTSLREEGELYHYKYADSVSGTDIVELIIKNNSKYDYYIRLSNINDAIEITKERAKKLMENREYSDIIWTQSYLTNIVLGEHIFSFYDFLIVQDNHGTLSFYFTER